jgi:glutamyl-Q tRNA(Asp) synthetase
MVQPIYRFAPSPNGRLHLGHAYSALQNEQRARQSGGRLLLRLEDIDVVRCTAEFCQCAIEDLQWLGIQFEPDIRVQSRHRANYEQALERLRRMGLLYGCDCSRTDREKAMAATGADPDGQPFYAGTCRERNLSGPDLAQRLDMEKALKLMRAPLAIFDNGIERLVNPEIWGDVILGRRDIGISYHVAVVVDDALQGVTHVVRGADLRHATAIHRLLQALLDLPAPQYEHHDLIRDQTGRKLAKSKSDTSLAELREQGATPYDIRRMLGFAS